MECSFYSSLSLQFIVPVIWLLAVVFNLPLLLTIYYNNESDFCMQKWPQEWMVKANTIVWFLVTGVTPILTMAVLYSRVVYALWFPEHEDTSDNVRQVSTYIHSVWLMHYMMLTHALKFDVCDIKHLYNTS